MYKVVFTVLNGDCRLPRRTKLNASVFAVHNVSERECGSEALAISGHRGMREVELQLNLERCCGNEYGG